MATRKPLVLVSGEMRELPAGDSLPTYSTVLDFGSVPSRSKSFSVAHVGATAGMLVMCCVSAVAPSPALNDLQMDTLVLGAVAGADVITFTAYALPGPVVGKFSINYQI